MNEKFQELKNWLRDIDDIESAAALMYWDQATYMPAGGASARGRQLATLSQIAHEKLIAPALGDLLHELEDYEKQAGYDSDVASLIRVARRRYERAVNVPPTFMAYFSRHCSESYAVWTTARPYNDFAAVKPYLKETLRLSRELADFFPGYDHIADPLIDFSDYGMKTWNIRQLFQQLHDELVPIVQTICQETPLDDSCVRQRFAGKEQIAFSEEVIKNLGYDFTRGRHDMTHHPFMTKFSLGDVRITTRLQEDFLGECLFSTIHEAGHAMYEQGICRDYEGSPLADGASSGVHESQSRLWENVVGRSREFWTFFYPKLQSVFPSQLGAVSLDDFYAGVNRVERTLIRTDADEVTYNLHVLIRFDLELAMLEGDLSIDDLPDVWRQRYREDLGIEPADNRDGVMQDVHWHHGRIGGEFQGYTLGNLMNAQFFARAAVDLPDVRERMSRGDFSALHDWLKENIYRHGAKYTADELVERVTGRPLEVRPFIDYIKLKYGQWYKV